MTSVGTHVFGRAFTKLERNTGWETPALDFVPTLLEQKHFAEARAGKQERGRVRG